MYVWCQKSNTKMFRNFKRKIFKIEIKNTSHIPAYSLLISKISARYCHYCANELVGYIYLHGR